jgi:hypothetical protein
MTSSNSSFQVVAQKLIKGSDKKKYDPFTRVDYQEKLNSDRWQFPEEFLSIYHSPIYSDLSDEKKWKLSLLEAVNFFSVNIHGEQGLVAAMEPRLYRNKRVGEDPVSSQYMQRFIHEENSHTYMLAEYCTRYHGSVLPDHTYAVEQPKLSPEVDDILYWGRVLTLESFLGYFNQKSMTNTDLDTTARQIHEYHHIDEVRHQAWDKAMIEENLRRARAKGLDSELQSVKEMLIAFQEYIRQSTCNPAVYRALGLENSLELREEAIKSKQRAEDLKPWSDGLAKYFAKIEY